MANRLIPVRIPWMVSPSTPLLQLYASEATSDNPTEVKTVGYFALEEEPIDQINPLVATVIPSIEELEISTEQSIGPYKLIRILFSHGLWVRMTPSHSDSEIIDWSIFQRSKSIPSLHAFRDASEYLNHFRNQWKIAGIRPDPRIYEVVESDWLRESKASGEEFHHYLILGHDSFIEILAKKWEWETIGVIQGL